MFIYRQQFKFNDRLPVYLPVEIDSDRIVFEVIVPNARKTWFRCGTLTRQILIAGIGFAVEEPKTIQIKKNLLEFNPEGNYRLEFTPYSWIPEYQISIWKL